MSNATQTFVILLSGFATLGIFSILWRENMVYRFFEHIFIGIATGWGIILTIKSFLWPNVLQPLLGLDIVRYPDGTLSKPYDGRVLLLIIPMLFGLLYYFIYSKRFAWIAKIVIGFQIGASSALYVKGFFNQMTPQVVSSFRPVLVFTEAGLDAWTSLQNMFFLWTLLTVMYYFFFSFRAEGRVARVCSGSGRWLLMVCFGAFFGSTVMARLALLVERVQFLFGDWIQTIFHLFA